MHKRLKRLPLKREPRKGIEFPCIALSAYTETTQNAIHALLASLEERDPYTFWHCVRVGQYSRQLAIDLDLPENIIDDAELSGLLHDVGKMGVPDYILNKADFLSPAEFAIMKSHAQRSAKLAATIPGIDHLVPGILHHHERWDGHGYPNGLSGEDIPLLSRVILVADTFDAMTSTRPYRLALPIHIAIAELRRCQGSQFDAQFSETFCQYLEKNMLTLPGKIKKIA
jgi:HD-GYP domain-containing protein (c-di-GMP phosphodiesterase class II)